MSMMIQEDLERLRHQVSGLQQQLHAAERREATAADKIVLAQVEVDRIHKKLRDLQQDYEEQRTLATEFRSRVDKIPGLEAAAALAGQGIAELTLERDKSLKKAAKAEEALKIANEDLAAVLQERNDLSAEIEPFRQMIISLKQQQEVEATIADLLTRIRGEWVAA